MDNLIVKDTMEIFCIDNSNTANVFFLGINTKSNLVQKMTNTILKAGIGNLPVGLIQTGKDMTFSVDPIFWNDSVLGMISGNVAAPGTSTVKYFDKGLTVSSGLVTLTAATPIAATTADIFDATNTHYSATVSGQNATIASPPVDGAVVTAIYNISVSGGITNLDAASFPKSFKLYGHTVAYNPSTNTIESDIYLILNSAISDGAINAAFEVGKESILPIMFQILIPINSTSFGQYLNIPRV